MSCFTPHELYIFIIDCKMRQNSIPFFLVFILFFCLRQKERKAFCEWCYMLFKNTYFLKLCFTVNDMRYLQPIKKKKSELYAFTEHRIIILFSLIKSKCFLFKLWKLYFYLICITFLHMHLLLAMLLLFVGGGGVGVHFKWFRNI